MAKDYYQILGISKNATADEIKSAFRRLAHLHHPDKPGGNAEKFKEINEAYQVLSDTQKRQQYDQYGQTFEQAQSQGGFGGFDGFRDWSTYANGAGINMNDLGDIFSQFGFGDAFGGGRSRGKSQGRSKGKDLALEMHISFKEMAFGVEKTISFNHRIVCSICKGSGAEPDSETRECKTCHGTGQVKQVRSTFFGQMQTVGTCGDCKGEGQIISKSCKHCRGNGYEEKKEDLSINVPAGIQNGQTLRLTGKGDAGNRGARTGDLYVTIHVEPHRGWDRDEDDIHSKATVRLAHALLGGDIDVETLDGVVSLHIPEGTQHGAVMRLKGKGITRMGRGGRADHYVHISIAIPSRLSRSARKAIEEIKNDL